MANGATHSASTLPYIGSKLSLISNSDIRYEGILYTINTTESTVALQKVKSFGTEGRKIPDIPPSDEEYDFIIFRGKDIKDLTVCAEPSKTIPDDPAIVNVKIAPTQWNGPPPGNDPTTISDPVYPSGNRGGGYRGGMYQQRGEQAHTGRYGNVRQQQMYGRYDDAGCGGRHSDLQSQGRRHQPQGNEVRYHSSSYANSYGANATDGTHHTSGGGDAPSARYHYHSQQNGTDWPRFVVGELTAQPNQATKKSVSREFDFETANGQFEKSAMKLEEVEKGGVTVRPGYDKLSSFFDNISCESLDRQSGHDGKVDRDRQRMLDAETFGQAANQKTSRYRRSYRTWGYRRGRGVGGYGYNRGGPHHHA